MGSLCSGNYPDHMVIWIQNARVESRSRDSAQKGIACTACDAIQKIHHHLLETVRGRTLRYTVPCDGRCDTLTDAEVLHRGCERKGYSSESPTLATEPGKWWIDYFDWLPDYKARLSLKV